MHTRHAAEGAGRGGFPLYTVFVVLRFCAWTTRWLPTTEEETVLDLSKRMMTSTATKYEDGTKTLLFTVHPLEKGAEEESRRESNAEARGVNDDIAGYIEWLAGQPLATIRTEVARLATEENEATVRTLLNGIAGVTRSAFNFVAWMAILQAVVALAASIQAKNKEREEECRDWSVADAEEAEKAE